MKTKNKPNIFLLAAGVLFCLVLVSVHFSAGMYARYTTRADGADSAHLAEFRVSAIPAEQQSLQAVAGQEETASYRILVQNRSETAVRWDVIVEFEADISGNLDIQLDGKAPKPEDVAQRSVAFRGVGELAPASSEEAHVLSMDLSGLLGKTAPSWTDFSNDSISGETGELPFTVRVVFTQVD